ncbi:ABC transporter ATP-binding protein [Streptomyces lasiicapitis]|uniref:ABC transporter ATP-binding protein n=1 Tax=Streptomyces lasiicapitis TaxID=1923961 RepID=UPI00365972EB
MGRAALTSSGLSRDFGGVGVFDVDLHIDRGSVYGLVGRNGAGKTTLLSMLAGLEKPDSGLVKLDGTTVSMCPDVPEFEPWLTALEVVELSAGLGAPRRSGVREQALRDDALHDAALRVLSRVGMESAARRRVGGFSRGMMQRLSLAAALVVRPDLLILDEPTSGLDPEGRRTILDLVRDLKQESTIILSSHIVHDVESVCDALGLLDGGRLVLQGRTADILHAHARPVWRLQSRSAREARILAAALRAEEWTLSVEPASEFGLLVEAASVEAGERGIPQVVSREGCALAGLTALDSDLESILLSVSSASASAVASMTGGGTRTWRGP